MRSCRICSHPEAELINKLLVQGLAPRAMAQRIGGTTHRRDHAPEPCRASGHVSTERKEPMKNVPTTEDPAGAELVILARPGGERDITLLTAYGPIRFLEGRAHNVPLSIARELAGPGWTIEPLVKLKASDGRNEA